MKNLKKPHNLTKNFENLIKLTFFTLIFTWFIFQFIIPLDFYSDIFAVLLAVTSLLGAIFSIHRSKDWGFYRSQIGLTLICFSLGLLMWFIGQSLYYLDSKIKEPLSIYEFFFIFIDPLYLLGLYFLANAIGTFKVLKSNISLIILPILVFILNFLIVSFINKGDFLEILNFKIEDLYIFGSIVLATFVLSIIIFSKKLGGIYKNTLYLILLGILLQFVGDNLFAFFENQLENGSLADLFFFASISMVTFGVFKLDPNKLNEPRI